jgi:hypothetical protein
MAQEQHGWSPQVLFKARRRLRAKAIRRGFGPGGYWSWKLPGHMTDKDVHFHPGEWRGFIAGHRPGVHRPTLDASSQVFCPSQREFEVEDRHQWRSLPDKHI